MTVLLALLLGFILGALAGFYARTLYNMVKDIYDDFTERREAEKVGVIRAPRIKATHNQPIDLSSESGSIMRASPDQARLAAIREREKRAKRL